MENYFIYKEIDTSAFKDMLCSKMANILKEYYASEIHISLETSYVVNNVLNNRLSSCLMFWKLENVTPNIQLCVVKAAKC
jgi:hypothetical protein